VVAGADATQHLSQIFSERQRLLCVNKLKQRKVLVAIKDSKCASDCLFRHVAYQRVQATVSDTAQRIHTYMLELLNWRSSIPITSRWRRLRTLTLNFLPCTIRMTGNHQSRRRVVKIFHGVSRSLVCLGHYCCFQSSVWMFSR
jgi:hypothetical protein